MDQLSAIKAFVRLGELGTFSAVAQDLRVRQSTVSKWIAGLENELGVQLVERTTRSLRITERGQSFLGDAREILASVEFAVERVREDTSKLRGRLRVSVPVVFGRLFVVQEISRFMAAHPDISVELLYSDRYLDLLEQNIDVAIRVGLPRDSSYRSHVLGESQRLVVASPDYVSTFGSPRSPSALAEHCCLSHTGLTQGDIWTFRRGTQERPIAVQGSFAANNSEALLEIAKDGHGVALLADWLVKPELESGTLVQLLKGWKAPPAPIRALTGPTRFPQPRVKALIQHLKTHFSARFTERAR